MPADSTYTQWNVRLDPETSTALRTHLGNPLLVGLPKGAVAEFFTRAVRAELAKAGAWPPPVATTDIPTFF